MRTDLDYGVEISWPLADKDRVVFRPNVPKLVFGDALYSTTGTPLELDREDVARIYAYVRETVAPRFTVFFGADRYS